MPARSEEKSDDSKDSFYEKSEEVFNHFCKYHTEVYYEILMHKWGKKILSSRQLGMRVYIRIVMIMVLE